MTKYNAENERVKRRYLTHLRAARGLSEASLDTVAKAIHRYELSTNYSATFESFTSSRRSRFGASWRRPPRPTPKASQCGHALADVKTTSALSCFGWRISLATGLVSDIQRPSISVSHEKDTAIAKANRGQPCDAEQIHAALNAMAYSSEIELRNRAIICVYDFDRRARWCGGYLEIKHVNLPERCVFQDARQVRTKNSKTFSTWFFPVGESPIQIFEHWVAYLNNRKAVWTRGSTFSKNLAWQSMKIVACALSD
jgi:hypothetical protein